MTHDEDICQAYRIAHGAAGIQSLEDILGTVEDKTIVQSQHEP
jgi:hypothetical protein